jgi:hypothetical protein
LEKKMHDDDLSNLLRDFPEVQFPEIPESDLNFELTEEQKKLIAEQEAMTRRWLDSGLKLGGHLELHPVPKTPS